MVGVLRRFDGPRGGRCWNCSVRLTLHTGRLFYARPHKFLVVWRNNNFSEETDYLKKKRNNRKRWGNLRYTIGIFSIRAIELFLFLSICYLYNICYYSIFREKKFPYNFYKYYFSRISIYIANRCLRSWKIFAINVTRRDCSTFNDKNEKTRPFPSLFPSLSFPSPSPSLSSASYKRRISRSAELRQKLARDKRVWREKRICHPLGAMLWCIVAKWMLNGLPALRDVKAFFSKIAAEICSAPRGLPRRPISDFHAWKGETARGGGQSEQFVSLNVNSRIYWWWERSQRRKLFYCTARHY